MAHNEPIVTYGPLVCIHEWRLAQLNALMDEPEVVLAYTFYCVHCLEIRTKDVP